MATLPPPPLFKQLLLPDGKSDTTWANWYRQLHSVINTGAAGGAPPDAAYVTTQPNGTLTREVNLGALPSGFVQSAVTSGVATLSTTPTIPPSALGAHHTTHETGGSDAVTALSGAVLTSGTVADARLSGNVALKTVDNTFVAQTLATGSTVSGANALVNYYDASQGTDQKRWRTVTATGTFYLQSMNDANTATLGGYSVDRTGNVAIAGSIAERGRSVPLGVWQNVPFNAANFTGIGGTWTVGSAAVQTNSFMLIGKTLFWQLYIGFDASNVGAGAGLIGVNIQIPGGFTAGAFFGTACPVAFFMDGGGIPAAAGANPTSTFVQFYRTDAGGLAAGAIVIKTTLFFEIA